MSGRLKLTCGQIDRLGDFLEALNEATANHGWVLSGASVETTDGLSGASLDIVYDGEGGNGYLVDEVVGG